MSALTPKRLFAVVVVLLCAGVAAASNPSPRTHARMAYDVESDQFVLFGGRVGVDPATGLAYASDETWTLNAKRWVQRFPAHRPSGRSVHSMVYDAKDDLVYLFGGRVEATEDDGQLQFLNDTWQWDGTDWTEVPTASAPGARIYAGMAYDSVRDRVVLFGGEALSSDGVTSTAIHDTWEFDGANWTRVGAEGEPKVRAPLLTYDAARNQVILLGMNETSATVMYAYDAATHVWSPLTPETLPPCVNEGQLLYRSRVGRPLYSGGICPIDNSGVVDTYEWNGTNWVKLTTNNPGRASGLGYAYDSLRDRPTTYGGIDFVNGSLRATLLQLEGSSIWRFSAVAQRPTPRSLGGFRSDAARESIWLLGGLSQDSSYYLSDFWRYTDGQWNLAGSEGMPLECVTPATAFDTNRQVLVVVCSGRDVFEFNGTEWKTFSDLSKEPEVRRFAGLVYDETLKKTVLFGGYTDSKAVFRNDTWTWDGTAWTEVKNNRPTHRSLMAMWYDPLLKKTVVYGGIGRPDLDTRVTRYEDMWSFSGTGWTKMNVSATPGARLGPAIAADPRTGKVLLLGGLRAEKVGDDQESVRQFYDNDLWQWDGSASTWTKLTPATLPPARENAMLAWDPIAEEMVLFGGYHGGLYYSDVWLWDGLTWTPVEAPTGRRRAVGSQ